MAIISNFFTNVIDIYMLYFYLKTFFTERKLSKKYVLFRLLILVVFNTFINAVLGLASFVGFILIIFLMSYIFSLLFNKEFLYIFIMLIIGIVIMFILELISVNLVVFLFELPPSLILELNVYRFLAIVIGKVGFFIIIRYWGCKIHLISWFQDRRGVPIAFIFLFNSIIIYMAFTLYRYVKIRTYTDYIILFMLTLCSIIFSWLIYVFTKKMFRQEQQEEFMKLKIKEYENQSFYSENMESVMMNIRAQRHDFNNYISTLYGLIYLNKTEEAKKYILDLAQSISFINEIIDVGHPVITALINVKRDKILREKIKMNLDIKLPKNLSYDYIDLSVIIGNLLDNAIEACLKPDIEHPFIDFKMHIKGNYLVIEVSNSKSSEVSVKSNSIGGRFTTKEDKENHGFGLNNIQRIVTRYEGLLKIEDKDSTFNVHIALPFKKDIA